MWVVVLSEREKISGPCEPRYQLSRACWYFAQRPDFEVIPAVGRAWKLTCG